MESNQFFVLIVDDFTAVFYDGYNVKIGPENGLTSQRLSKLLYMCLVT